MKSKILFIMHMPPPIHGAAMVGKYIQDSELINKEFTCSYINLSASTKIEEVGKLSFKKFTFIFTNLYKIIRTILKEKPDLVYYTPTCDGYAIFRDMITLGCIKLFVNKTILHLHNKGIKNFSQKRFTHFAYQTIFHKSKVILIAKELYNDVCDFIEKDDIFICPNGIPQTNNINLDASNHKEPYTFLFLSNMIDSKGVTTLMKACSLLKRNGYKFKCNFIGKWSDISEDIFNTLAKNLNIEKYVFALGPKYGNEKDNYFINSDAFVFPTNFPGEVFSLVLLEAMQHALPCISTNNGGIPSIIDNNITGFIIRPKDEEVLADKMSWLINNPQKGIEMGLRGKQKFEKYFTLNVFENNFINILKEYLAK